MFHAKAELVSKQMKKKKAHGGVFRYGDPDLPSVEGVKLLLAWGQSLNSRSGGKRFERVSLACLITGTQPPGCCAVPFFFCVVLTPGF